MAWVFGPQVEAAVVPDPQTISPSGIASASAFGTGRLNEQIRPVAIASAEAHGYTRVKFPDLAGGMTRVRARSPHTEWNFSSPYNKGIMLCWPMREGAGKRIEDISPNRRHAETLIVSRGTGRIQGSAVAYADDNYVSRNPGGSTLGAMTQGTVELWFYANDYAKTGLWSWIDDPNLSAFSVSWDGSGVFYISYLFPLGAINDMVATDDLAINPLMWNHIVVTSDGSAWKLYFNGVETGLGTTVSGSGNTGLWFGDAGTELRVGSTYDDFNSYQSLNGKTSRFAIWNRPLSLTEVKELYTRGDQVLYRQENRIEARRAAMNQFVVPSGVAGASAIGTHKINEQIRPVAIAGTSAVGTAKLNQQIRPVALAGTSAFGTPTLNQQIRAVGVASASAFGTARLNQQIRASGIASAEALGTPRVNQQIRPVALAGTSAIGTPSLAQQIRAVGVASTSAFGTARLNQQIRAVSIASAEAFGTAVVANLAGNQTIVAVAIASASAFGAAQLNQQIRPVALAGTSAVGTPTLLQSQLILPGGIASAGAFGLARLNQLIVASGVASAEAFGTASLTLVIQPAGIASAAAFGLAQLNQQIRTAGIAATAVVGTGLYVFHGVAVPTPKRNFVINLGTTEAIITAAQATKIIALLASGASVTLASAQGLVTIIPGAAILNLPTRAKNISL